MKKAIITLCIVILSASGVSQNCQRIVNVDVYQIVNKNIYHELYSRILPYMQERKMDSGKYVIGLGLFSIDNDFIDISVDERTTLSMDQNVLGVCKFVGYDLIVYGEKKNKKNISFVIKVPFVKKKMIAGRPVKDGTIEWTYYVKSDSLILVDFRDAW